MAAGEWLDAKDVARKLGISVSAVHGLRERGTLPSEWIGSTRVWKKEVVDRYLADAAAQARRRSGKQLVLAGLEMTTDEAIAHANAMKLQAPAGFDPEAKARGGGK